MDRVAQKEFLERTDDFIKSLSAIDPKLKRKKENKFTAKIIIPLVEKGLNLDADFDDTDETGRRPDIQAFLKPRVDNDGPIILVESKWPTEFEGLNVQGIVEKFLSDKYQPYILTHKLTCRFFIIHNFERYLVTSVDEKLIQNLEMYKASKISKTVLVKEILARTKDFNLVANPKKFKTSVGNFLGYLDTDLNCEVLKASLNSTAINSVVISNDTDLRKIAERITTLVGTKDGQSGLLQEIEGSVHKELSKTVSSLKMVYRLFLSTRRPDLENGQELESKADNERERDIFVLSSMYALVGKVFLVKFIQDLFSDQSRGLLDEDLCFLHKPIPESEKTHLGRWFKTELEGMKKGLPEAAQRLLVRNSFFDWVLDKDCLNNNFFRDILVEFQKVDLRKSFDESNYDGDLLGAFFEVFTERFSKATRQALGQYYTPKPIVRYMWGQVREIIKAEGLSKTDVRILDPACGSGTFLVQAVKELWSEYEDEMLERLVAFDISPFVVGLAEINVFSEVMKHANRKQLGKLKPIEIFNSDSLDIRESAYWKSREGEETEESNLKFLKDQSHVATKLKKKREYTVIVTNPPYNGSSTRNLGSLKGRFDLTDNLLEKSTKDNRIRDDYVWFMAAIDRYINQNGIVCLITAEFP
ncbi:MAG: SAM-dependent methyltransferase [Bdellovibrionales bacterium]|nr:SAM-dependent methyltransferase [Bdellovibrionales bacterium]